MKYFHLQRKDVFIYMYKILYKKNSQINELKTNLKNPLQLYTLVHPYLNFNCVAYEAVNIETQCSLLRLRMVTVMTSEMFNNCPGCTLALPLPPAEGTTKKKLKHLAFDRKSEDIYLSPNYLL